MGRLLILSVIQSCCLALGQVFLKFAMRKMEAFRWAWSYFGHLFTNWWFLLVGITMGGATVLWLYILKHYPLSVAYPLSATSYVFGMLAALFLLHESIPITRWMGVLVIMFGVMLIVK